MGVLLVNRRLLSLVLLILACVLAVAGVYLLGGLAWALLTAAVACVALELLIPSEVSRT